MLFYIFSCILFFLIVGQINAKSAFINFLIGLIVQSAETLKASSGFSLFWFIPCYVFLTLVRSLGSRNRYLYYSILFVALAFHFGVAGYLSSIFDTFPFSFHVALYCYPVCLLFNKIKSLLLFNRYVKYGSVPVFILTCIYIAKGHCPLFFSSSIFPAYTNPLGILIHDACALSCIGAFSLIYDLAKSGFVMKAGEFSFEFYLMHQFASYLVIYSFGESSGLGSIVHASAVIAMTMLGVLGLQKIGAYKYIFSTGSHA